ncbi:chemotaxis protein CheW [Methanoplanus sp. FWC-SCC4]|uniref:Chemotaxis protein CheW n=1 Tax=Methanochimaera problematica TaxID=2609417 RepID=A0AA97FEC3_9EURY|nr:chemotaxis protein CheW [Methanoplanus sp. FWC-SCC4]WOF16982.1 chemotaxis protein CheW [Methanoplanus sp. FWC-SCC4]
MAVIDVVVFEISKTLYALDINLAREIVEMMPITPVPRAPSHIAGIINLRGEITNIINLNRILNLPENEDIESQKIIVLVPEATGGSNIGIIVDNVHSVIQVDEDRIDPMDNAISKEAYVKGIIKEKSDIAEGEGKTDLIIWIDLSLILADLYEERT